MHTLFTVSLVWGWLLLSSQNLAQAQVAVRAQPILLSESACCASPARIPVGLPTSEYRSTSYMSPSVAESMPTVVYAPVASPASSLALSEPLPVSPLPVSPLPVSPRAPIVEYRFYAPVSETVTTMPLTQSTPASSLPRDYVVGSNVIGQPKLFKPGQPVRNFFRYLTL